MAMGIVDKSCQSKENAWSPAILVTLCNIALEVIGYYYYTVSSFYEYVPYITRTNINYNTLGWSRVLKQFFFHSKKNLNWYLSLDYPKTPTIRAKRITKSSWWGETVDSTDFCVYHKKKQRFLPWSYYINNKYKVFFMVRSRHRKILHQIMKSMK